MRKPTRPVDRIRWLQAVNNSSSLTIPAFGVCRVVSVNSKRVYTIDRPNADSMSLTELVFNGPQPIPPSGNGSVTADMPADALYDTADGTPAIGEEWGTETDSYKLAADKTGVPIAGGAETSPDRVQVRGAGGSGGNARIIIVTSASKDSDGYQDGEIADFQPGAGDAIKVWNFDQTQDPLPNGASDFYFAVRLTEIPAGTPTDPVYGVAYTGC